MDYNEVVKGFKYRHPWELSRTKCIHKVWEKYYREDMAKQEQVSFINVGAGDCFFDRVLTEKYGYRLTAVDIAYPKDLPIEKNIVKVNSLDEASYGYDFAIMMDSLEYFDDDKAFVRELASRVREGGYLFLTLPAHKKLFADHDVLVGNKRRYDYTDILGLQSEENGLHMVECGGFYWSLYLVRVLQKALKMKADEKVTTGWNQSEKSFLTKFFTMLLNFDFYTSRLFRIKGLSWYAVFKIDGVKRP